MGKRAAILTSASRDASALSERGMPTTSRQTTQRGRCPAARGTADAGALARRRQRVARPYAVEDSRAAALLGERRLGVAVDAPQAIWRDGGLMAGRPSRLLL